MSDPNETRRNRPSTRCGYLALLCWFSAVGCDGPTVSHPVTTTDDDYCLSCHGEEPTLTPAAAKSHDNDGCVDCHEVEDYWSINDADTRGDYLGAPTYVPHRAPADDDELCLSCHAEGEWGAQSTAHPDLADCMSCHQAIE